MEKRYVRESITGLSVRVRFGIRMIVFEVRTEFCGRTRLCNCMSSLGERKAGKSIRENV
jgi:hypothetical protein